MRKSEQDAICPFLKELLSVLAEGQPSWPLSAPESLFQRLLDLEKRAREADAPLSSLEAIASVRRLAGIAATSPMLARVCGH